MAQSKLLKSIEGLELWTTVTETTQHFAVKFGRRRARVLQTPEEAERYFTAALDRMRGIRSQ